jgi:hypothetical protein
MRRANLAHAWKRRIHSVCIPEHTCAAAVMRVVMCF